MNKKNPNPITKVNISTTAAKYDVRIIFGKYIC